MSLFNLFRSKNSNNKFTDPRDGKVYKFVEIGEQVWMAENLNYKAENGCWYFNDNPNHGKKYGKLYNWDTAMESCPEGWHLPSQEEWDQLIKYVGNMPGTELKSGIDWIGLKDLGLGDEDGNGQDTFGFSGRPAGTRDKSGVFDNNLGRSVKYWSSTSDTENAMAYELFFNNTHLSGSLWSKQYGFSVRCIKD